MRLVFRGRRDEWQSTTPLFPSWRCFPNAPRQPPPSPRQPPPSVVTGRPCQALCEIANTCRLSTPIHLTSATPRDTPVLRPGGRVLEELERIRQPGSMILNASDFRYDYLPDSPRRLTGFSWCGNRVKLPGSHYDHHSGLPRWLTCFTLVIFPFMVWESC